MPTCSNTLHAGAVRDSSLRTPMIRCMTMSAACVICLHVPAKDDGVASSARMRKQCGARPPSSRYRLDRRRRVIKRPLFAAFLLRGVKFFLAVSLNTLLYPMILDRRPEVTPCCLQLVM